MKKRCEVAFMSGEGWEDFLKKERAERGDGEDGELMRKEEKKEGETEGDH